MKKLGKLFTVAFLTAFLALTLIPISKVFAGVTTSVTASEGDTAYSTSSAVVVDPNITVTGDTISGAKVMINNRQTGDVLSYTATLPSGVSGSYSSTTGLLTFTGSATADQWQSILRTVTFNTTSTVTTTRTISFTLGTAIPLNGHYYEYVSGAYTWTSAKSAAESKSFFGLQGYLATITSAEENQFILEKLQSDAWIGASDNSTYNGGLPEGYWCWVTGPENGTLFSTRNISPVSYSGRYMNWNSGEPNDSGSNEDFAEIYCSNNGGKWNDLPNTSTLGYVVEYGGMSGDPTVQISDTKNVSIASYSITYNLDGGTNYAGAPTSYTPLTNTITLGTPTKAGYNFVGWYDAATDGNKITQIVKGSSGNVVLYARWSIKQYTVTFKDYNGNTLKTETVDYHSSATPPSDPTRTGYTFDSWSGTYINIEAAQTVTAVYTANTNTAYTVKHYQQDVTGSGYTLKDTENLTGTTDTTTTAAAKTYTGFSENTTYASRVTSGNIAGDGSLVLSLYYDRAAYTVTFKDYNGNTLKTETVRYDGSVTAPSDPERAGYTFDSWSGTYTNVKANQTVTAVYTANTNIAYKVNHYKQDVTGDGYTLIETQNLTGTTDTTATAVAKTYTGFSENTTYASRVASGNIAADGSLVLSLYYDRETYTVTFKDYNDNTLKTETVRYDGSATAPSDPTRAGYTFSSWSGTYTNVKANQTVTAIYTANTNTAYTVKHYQQDVTGDGYTLKDTENLTGTTDTTATAVAKTYTGFSENTTYASRVASGNIAGDGSLVLSLYYDRATYTVTFKDYNDSVIKADTVRYDGSATAPSDPTRTGYTFDSWSGTYTNVKANQTVTAIYTANTNTAYTVKHYQQDVTGDGYTLKDTENLTGTTDTTATAAAKTYTGFSENTTYASRVASGNIAGDGSLVLSLYYDRATYTVTFKDYNDSVIKADTVRYEGSATAPSDPTRAGYTFDSWSGTYTNVKANQTVTAIYTANTNTAYTVKHYQQDVTGDGYTLKDTENLTGTTDTTATAVAKTYAGFSENTTYASRVASGNIAGDGSLVLSLYYDRATYTVTFKDYNGSTLKTETVRYDGSATVPSDPERAGYTFSSWSGTYTNVKANQTVKAEYLINTYRIQYNSVGGTSVLNADVAYNELATKPTDPSKEGYRFAGWYKEEDYENIWDFSTERMPASNMILFAKWILTPSAPVLDTKTSVMIKLQSDPDSNLEYRVDGGAWQDSPIFENLQPNTDYTFEARVKEDDPDPASYTSEPSIIKTNKILVEGSSEEYSITGAEGTSFDPETELVVEHVNETLSTEDGAAYIANLKLSSENETISELYEIKLVLDNEEIQPNGMIRIKIKLTEKLKAVRDQIKIVYISDDGEYEVIPHEIEGDYVVFEINHLSVYAIIVPVKQNLPATGESSSYTTMLGLKLIIVSILLLLLRKKYKQITN